MIDEEKLIEDILKHSNNITSEWETAGILNLINQQPKVGEWIPVSQRFPDEEYDTVLAVTDKNHYAVYVYTTEHGFRTMDIDAEGEVIAWMPLPAPYDMRKKVEE